MINNRILNAPKPDIGVESRIVAADVKNSKISNSSAASFA
jgi:hypothetical protein